jgi:hypothetical protein
MANYHPVNEQHVIKYWKGMFGNPSEHDTPDMVFLKCNVDGGSATRSLGPISITKKIFVPVNPVAVTGDEKPKNNKEERKKFAKDDEDSASKALLTIDGGDTHDIKEDRFRQVTDEFDAGSTTAVADGYYVIIDPLPVGQHTVRFQGRVEDAKVGRSPWEQDVTYNIEVR